MPPSISIDIGTNAEQTRTVDALCAVFLYQTTINGSPNPENRNQFAKRMAARVIKDLVVGYETSLAAETARATAKATSDSLNIT